MDTVFFIGISLISLIAIIVIIKMISNRMKGKDELDGLLTFKYKKKDQI
jgi:hypothetical protein